MNNEMTLDKAVKLSDEELDGIAGGSVLVDNHAARFKFTTPEGGTLLRTAPKLTFTDAVGPLMYNVRRKAGVGIPDGKGDACSIDDHGNYE